MQQSQVEDQAESRAEVQTPPGISVSDDSETQNIETSQDQEQEQSLRLTNQEPPLPSGTSSELEMQTEINSMITLHNRR